MENGAANCVRLCEPFASWVAESRDLELMFCVVDY